MVPGTSLRSWRTVACTVAATLALIFIGGLVTSTGLRPLRARLAAVLRDGHAADGGRRLLRARPPHGRHRRRLPDPRPRGVDGAPRAARGRPPPGLGRPRRRDRPGRARRPDRDLPAAHPGLRHPCLPGPAVLLHRRSPSPTVTSREWIDVARRPRTTSPACAPRPRLATAAVFVQLLLGAVMRHIGAGLAIPDFPAGLRPLAPARSTRAAWPSTSRTAWARSWSSPSSCASWPRAAARRGPPLPRVPRRLVLALVLVAGRAGRGHRPHRQGGPPDHRPRRHRGRDPRACWLDHALRVAPAPARGPRPPPRGGAVLGDPAGLVSSSALSPSRARRRRRLPRADQAAHHADGDADRAGRLRDGLARPGDFARPRGRPSSGTGLVAAGASALNMLLERRTDAPHAAHAEPPAPAGRLRPAEALACGLRPHRRRPRRPGLALGRRWPALVALVTWASYLFLYTPLKTRTSLSTVVGALPGRPAARHRLGGGARAASTPAPFVLFAILFLWQIPHFLAIAWIYREDYARGGLPMLPVLDPEGAVTGRQAVANSLALLLVSLAPAVAGLAGRLYLAGAIVLGIAFTAVAVWAAVRRTPAAARALFLASILYLVALCALLLVDRI